jgi:hypothetical protein
MKADRLREANTGHDFVGTFGFWFSFRRAYVEFDTGLNEGVKKSKSS